MRRTELDELCHSELFLSYRLLGHGRPGTVPEHARLLLPPGPCLHHGEGVSAGPVGAGCRMVLVTLELLLWLHCHVFLVSSSGLKNFPRLFFLLSPDKPPVDGPG